MNAFVRLTVFASVAVALLSGLSPRASAGDIFPDENLEAAIKEVLRKQGKTEIKEEDLKNVFQVTARGKGIKSLKGLEKCTSMVLINLSRNEIEDVSPIAGLKNLQSLDLSKNKIKDISSLKDLKKLQYLQLEENQTEDISALKDLKALSAIYLTGNKVKSVEPLKGLPKVASLYLGGNQVKDVKAIGTLKWLANLGLEGNQVEDISPLAALTELRFTFLQKNQIKDFGPLIAMAEKDAKGDKRFAPYWKLYLDDNPIDAAKKGQQIDALKKIGVRINWKPKK